MKHTISFLKNPVQEYAWGSRTAIAQILGESVPSKTPQAELWLGAHPKAPSSVLQEHGWVSLADCIQHAPEEILGREVATRFANKLPFLLKILAAEKPLSIQAHPDLARAKEGFTRENLAQIPLNAHHRNYRDDNHKPELLCALTPFWALKGFRSKKEILELIEKIGSIELGSEIDCIRTEPVNHALRCFFSSLLDRDKETQRQLVGRVVGTVQSLTQADPVFDWIIRLHNEYPGDIGTLAPLFLNLIQLQPGEAMFIEAGTLHAYLEGTGIELMANSDNVLRGGLTPKHVDIGELLEVLTFSEEPPGLVTPMRVSACETHFPTPAEEFALSLIDLSGAASYESNRERSVEILMCTQGSVTIICNETGETIDLAGGKSVVVPACAAPYRIEGKGMIYKASVPLLST